MINTKLTITDLAEQKPMVIFLVSDACAVPLVSEVIQSIIQSDLESLHETG